MNKAEGLYCFHAYFWQTFPEFVYSFFLWSKERKLFWSFAIALWQYGLLSFLEGGTKLKIFLHKNQHTQRKLSTSKFWINDQLSKLILSKNGNNKNVLLSWYSSMKKMRKILIIFDIEKWLWKSNFGTFDTSPLTQFSKFDNFLWVCWFLGKNLSNFVPPFENSTTCIAILQLISYWWWHSFSFRLIYFSKCKIVK